MADESNAAGTQPGGDTNAAPAQAAADTTVLTGGGAPPPADTGATEDNWRTRFAGEDKQALKRLERFSTEADFFKSYREAENALRSGPKLPTLPESATPEEIAAYRKAVGIPEAPEGYELKFSDGVAASEADVAALGDFAKFMHDRNVPPGAVKAAQEYYEQRMVEGRAAMAEAAQRATLEAQAELRGEWKGGEYTRNMKIADEFLTRHFSELPGGLDAINRVLSLTLPEGHQVMHDPAFMKGLVAMARAYADDESLVSGDVIGGKSIDDEYRALIKESTSNPREFAKSAAKQQRLEELAGVIAKRGQRAA